MQQSIWRLSRADLAKGYSRGGVHVMTVVAIDEERARQLASVITADNHDNVYVRDEFLDPLQTNCDCLGYALPEIEEGVQCVDYDYDYDSVNYPWIKR